MVVTVPNGERVPCVEGFHKSKFAIKEEACREDFFVLPLIGYDVVIGTQWLTSLGQILWDFGALTVSFWRRNHCVSRYELGGLASPTLMACSSNNLMEALIVEFVTFFTAQNGLPPPKSQDHNIHLLPGSLPVAIWPNIYPDTHKDEQES